MRGLGRTFKRGPTWWVAYSHRGKEFRESSHSENESQAKRLLKKRLGEISRGRLIGPVEEKVTFEEMAQGLVTDYEINGKRSLRSIKLSGTHLRQYFGLDRALDVDAGRVGAYIKHRQDEGASNASINRELSALKRMFSLTVRAGRLSARPYIPSLEENNARQGFVDHGGFLALREALPEHYRDPVTFLYLSGWRSGEMKAVGMRDYDRAGRVLRLRPEISKNKNGRVLPLRGELLEVVKRAWERRQLECPFLFHVNGKPIGDFRKAWHQACCDAGLGRMEVQEDGRKKYVGTIPHDLRRTAIRNLIRSGTPERVAMTLSGHKTRSIFDRYNIVDEADLAKASERLHSHLKKQPGKPKVAILQGAKKAV